MAQATLRPGITPDTFNQKQIGTLPHLIGMRITAVGQGELQGELALRPELMAPNGFLHAATVIALADSLAGYGTVAHLPEGAKGFTTIELKSNFLSTATAGTITAVATAVHLGRNTHVWDATVTGPEGRTMALFRCTQMVLY
jgi:uncharacterized protein (TIGR00369 family)